MPLTDLTTRRSRSAPRPTGARSLLVRLLVCALLAGLALAPATTHAAGQTAPTAPKPKALVLEPFAAELDPGENAGQREALILTNAGFAVTVVSGKAVTVPLMLRLNRYSLIYVVTHAGPLPNGDAAVATGDTRHRRYTKYFADSSVVTMHIKDDHGVMRSFDAISGRFIHRHVGIFPKQSIVFVDSCTALDMPVFWRYLHKAGVATLISWHHHVPAINAENAATFILSAMASGETVEQAVSAAHSVDVGIVNTEGKPGWLSYEGDGTNSFAQVRDAVQAPPSGN